MRNQQLYRQTSCEIVSSNVEIFGEYFMRRMVESFGRRREKETIILPTHLLILGLLKHLVLFSEDTIEKDGFVLEKDAKKASQT